jgi:hypothetical protein
MKECCFLQTFHQLKRDFVAFNPHHTLFGAAVTEEVDAAVPNGFLVDNCKFLVDFRFVIIKDFVFFE